VVRSCKRPSVKFDLVNPSIAARGGLDQFAELRLNKARRRLDAMLRLILRRCRDVRGEVSTWNSGVRAFAAGSCPLAIMRQAKRRPPNRDLPRRQL
jgi:hypothetical protein